MPNIIKGCGGIVLICFIFFTSIKTIAPKEYVWFEAEDAEDINYPLKVVEINSDEVSHGKAIKTEGAANVHRAVTGYATYRINLSNSGRYFVWTRCYWSNACANSFLLSVNQGGKKSFGDDGVLNTWHWLLAAEFDLKPGNNNLLLWNSELGAIIDRFVITSDNNFRPSGLGELSELIENFDSNVLSPDLKYDRKYWYLVNDSGYNNALYCKPLVKKPSQKILIDGGSSLKYIFMTSVKFKKNFNKSENAQLYFNYLNESNFYMLTFYSDNITLVKKEADKLSNIGRFDIKNFNYNTYYDFMIINEDSITKIKFCGNTIFNIENMSEQIGKMGKSGKIGIGSTSGDVYFDNLFRLANSDISYTQNFHFKVIFPTYKKPETMFNYSEIFKVGGLYYWILGGDWQGFWPFQLKGSYSYVESLNGKRNAGKDAMVVIGQYSWKDYSFKCCIKNSNHCGSGLCFYYQNEKNYYLLKLIPIQNNTNVQLATIKDGQEYNLGEKCLPLISIDDWTKTEIRVLNSKIKVIVDDQIIFDLSDNTFRDGKVGFWTNSDQYVSYDDVEVSSIKDLNILSSDTYDYNFQYEMQSSRDISDWKLTYVDLLPYTCINKKLFRESIITHKKQFSGDITVSLFADMPNDIGAFFRLSSITKQQQKQNEYTCQFSDSCVSIFKNNQVQKKEKPNKNGNSFQLKKTDKVWGLSLNGISVLEWKDNEPLYDYNLSVGFCGIGAGNIWLHNIKIKKNGFNK